MMRANVEDVQLGFLRFDFRRVIIVTAALERDVQSRV